MFSRTIFKITTSGMERIIPMMPQTQNEKAVTTKSNTGEMSRARPAQRVSITFPQSC